MQQPAARVLIVGAGHAGGRVAHHLRALGHAGEITLAGAEAHPPYERPPLSKAVLAGTQGPEAVALKPAAGWQEAGVTLITGDPVCEIDSGARIARLASGRRLGFDILVMATGCRNRPLPAAEGAPVFGLRSLDESLALRARLGASAHLAVVGGGVIGLEVAAATVDMGLAVSVLEAGPRVMARILSPAGSDWLAGLHAAAGIDLRCGVQVDRVAHTAPGMRIETATGRLHADAVLVAIGVLPETTLLPGAARGPAGGFLCDAACRVEGFAGRVLAVGDVAEAWNPLYDRPLRLETWRNAETQARIAAATICGAEPPVPELPWMWTDQLGRNIQVLGLWHDGLETVARGPVGAPGSVEFWLEGGVLRGALLTDAGRERRHLEPLIRARARPDPAALADPGVRLKDLARATAA